MLFRADHIRPSTRTRFVTASMVCEHGLRFDGPEFGMEAHLSGKHDSVVSCYALIEIEANESATYSLNAALFKSIALDICKDDSMLLIAISKRYFRDMHHSDLGLLRLAGLKNFHCATLLEINHPKIYAGKEHCHDKQHR